MPANDPSERRIIITMRLHPTQPTVTVRMDFDPPAEDAARQAAAETIGPAIAAFLQRMNPSRRLTSFKRTELLGGDDPN